MLTENAKKTLNFKAIILRNIVQKYGMYMDVRLRVRILKFCSTAIQLRY